MKGFKFKLQKLLDIRMDKEEQCKVVFQTAQNEKKLTEDTLNNFKNQYVKYREPKREDSIIEKKIKNNYLNILNIRIRDTEVELKEKKEVVEEKRIELITTQVERKTVEILKDKRKDEFIKMQDKLEQNFIDELALYSYIRKLERR